MVWTSVQRSKILIVQTLFCYQANLTVTAITNSCPCFGCWRAKVLIVEQGWQPALGLERILKILILSANVWIIFCLTFSKAERDTLQVLQRAVGWKGFSTEKLLWANFRTSSAILVLQPFPSVTYLPQQQQTTALASSWVLADLGISEIMHALEYLI